MRHTIRYAALDETLLASAIAFIDEHGQLVASGLPDPVWLRVEGEAWIRSHTSDEHCPECEGHLQRSAR